MTGLFLPRMKLSYSGWLLNREVSQAERLQEPHTKSLYSASLEVITSGLPADTLHSMHGSGIAPIRAGTLATRPAATLCSLQGLSKEENLWNIIMEYKM